jgi:hypothetical protein
MPMHPLLVASRNFTIAVGLGATFNQFVLNRVPVWDLLSDCSQDTGYGPCAQHHWSHFTRWISEPRMVSSKTSIIKLIIRMKT